MMSTSTTVFVTRLVTCCMTVTPYRQYAFYVVVRTLYYIKNKDTTRQIRSADRMNLALWTLGDFGLRHTHVSHPPSIRRSPACWLLAMYHAAAALTTTTCYVPGYRSSLHVRCSTLDDWAGEREGIER